VALPADVLAALGDLMALINMITALTVSWAAVDKMWAHHAAVSNGPSMLFFIV
jgi:hypothetical protein